MRDGGRRRARGVSARTTCRSGPRNATRSPTSADRRMAFHRPRAAQQGHRRRRGDAGALARRRSASAGGARCRGVSRGRPVRVLVQVNLDRGIDQRRGRAGRACRVCWPRFARLARLRRRRVDGDSADALDPRRCASRFRSAARAPRPAAEAARLAGALHGHERRFRGGDRRRRDVGSRRYRDLRTAQGGQRERKIGFIGAGNMAGALAKGLLADQESPARDLWASDAETRQLARFARTYGVGTGSRQRRARRGKRDRRVGGEAAGDAGGARRDPSARDAAASLRLDRGRDPDGAARGRPRRPRARRARHAEHAGFGRDRHHGRRPRRACDAPPTSAVPPRSSVVSARWSVLRTRR